MSISNREIDDYLETALWSSTDNSDESGGEPLDRNFNVDDFSKEAREQARDDCEMFYEQARFIVDALERDGKDVPGFDGWPHDFWLTRNRHGVGFWDREDAYGEAAEPLTELAQRFSERSVEINRRFKVRWEGNESFEEEIEELVFI